MKAPQANIINAITLIAVGLWGYFETSSGTAFIPVGFGVALLLCQPGVIKENKVIAHIAVVLTLLILLAMLGMRLPKALAAESDQAIKLLRAGLPIITGILAMVAFVQSFIAARKAREAAQ
ncbi:MAG: hypothetical protein AAFQ02_00650 [Bacteroidota bacterium]